MHFENQPNNSKMSSRIPQEILTEILVRLPVKSLLRFRSVSRSWNSLIASQMFISLHLNCSIESHYPSIILRHHDVRRQLELFTIYRDDGESFIEDQELEFPIKTDNYYYICACNGLLCFSNKGTEYLSIVLWNPSIRTCFQVPRSINETRDNSIGLGFDCWTGQYKVLRLTYANYRCPIPQKVEVFVLGTDKWRKVHTHVPFVVSEYSNQACLHGAIHWIGHKNGSTVIVVFDVHEEVFRDIEVPSGIADPCAYNLSLAVYGTSLCLLEHPGRSDMFSIWVMKQYGMNESWTKQFTVEMDFQGGSNRMLGLRKHDKIFVENESTEELVSYDLQSGKVEQLVEGKKHDRMMDSIPNEFVMYTMCCWKKRKTYWLHEYHAAIPHAESLVLMEGTNGIEREVNSHSWIGLRGSIGERHCP